MFAVPFLGPKNGPIFGAASYNSNKDGPIWRPQNWNPEIANIWPKLLIFWSRGLFLVPPLSGNHPDVLLAFEVSMLVHFSGPALEDDGFQSFHQFANAGQQQI